MSRSIITAPKWNNEGVSFLQFVLVSICSGVINSTVIGGMVLLFLFIDAATARPTEQQPEIEQKNEVEDVPEEKDLTSTDIGLDSSVPLNYNVDNIQEVSVPGPVDPTAAVGIVNAPEAAPTNVPPPPGSGGGTGAAMIDPNMAGQGAMAGTLGGMGGIYAPGGFGGRSGATRQKMLAEGGGNSESEAAVARGLRFLALHQSPDGSWSLNQFNRFGRTEPLPKGKIQPNNCTPETNRNNNTAGTAFGLLPFLAAGITNKPSKDGFNQIDYTKGVGMAIRWLINQQVKSGNQAGYYGGDQYSHGLATIAMCEAYGLTSDPSMKASAQMAINYIVNAQDPSGGGWRYSPRSSGDTSVTGWMVMALKSGQMAGLTVPKTTLKKAEQFINSCETSPGKGGYGYLPGSGETVTMTAVGALCKQYMGTSPRNASLLASVKKIKGTPPARSQNIYYLYYATQVMHHMGGEAWDFWNLGPDGKGGIRDTLIARQDKGMGGKPAQAGSFQGNDHAGGRLGATSMSLLSLEVYYRHLPLYRRDAGMMKDKP
jgi:hypothetical protein